MRPLSPHSFAPFEAFAFDVQPIDVWRAALGHRELPRPRYRATKAAARDAMNRRYPVRERDVERELVHARHAGERGLHLDGGVLVVAFDLDRGAAAAVALRAPAATARARVHERDAAAWVGRAAAARALGEHRQLEAPEPHAQIGEAAADLEVDVILGLDGIDPAVERRATAPGLDRDLLDLDHLEVVVGEQPALVDANALLLLGAAECEIEVFELEAKLGVARRVSLPCKNFPTGLAFARRTARCRSA